MATDEYSILVVGGTGQTGSRLAELLHAAGIPTLNASRSGKAPEGMTGVAFNWTDENSFKGPFETAKDNGLPTIRAVYMIGPPLREAVPPFRAFLEIALSKGARRFVLMSSATVEEGGQAMGKPHALLKELGNEHKLEWAVLRPTWFQENFSRQGHHLKSITQEGKVYSTTGDGKIPFISVDDIAACAKELLTTPGAPNSDYLILGPEPLSYGDLAAILSEVLGRKIVHDDLSPEALEQRLLSFGFPAPVARMLPQMETDVRHGSADSTNDVVVRLTGKKPKTLREYVEENKAVWTQG